MITAIRITNQGPDFTLITSTHYDRAGFQVATVQRYHTLGDGRTGLEWEKVFASEQDAVDYHAEVAA